MIKQAHKATIARFIRENCYRAGKCFLWKGERSIKNIPVIQIGRRRTVAVRAAWWVRHGYRPIKEHLTNTCGVKGCVRLDHYTDKTPLDQRSIVLFKKRVFVHALTPEQCHEVYELLDFGEKVKYIAKAYGVDEYTVYSAACRHRISGQTRYNLDPIAPL